MNSFVGFSQNFSGDEKSKFRIGLSGGVAYRIAKSPGHFGDNVDNYIKDLRFGQEFNADATYFFRESIGVGIKYSSFWAAASTHNPTPSILSNINIFYLGPIFYSKIPINSARSKLFYGVSVGYMRYKDDGWIDSKKTMMKGSAAGGLFDFCYDFKIVKGLHIGVNAGLSGGVVNNMKLDGVPVSYQDDQKEGLSRASGSAGLRYIW